ncbi:uncharacterized protein CIMG_04986 [Coccidioides immitis RS]|uniref:Uncharacterized protein n=1 Tax=Coccidioides immitis (strain RS) TaxID=246410 RepID=J3KEN3_COCIM|nr:uncharacterized protein CIMG_04986 [Coccidioides immitis RS]EAS33962.3 hypothetical protein CIMG_04986 [Coccidioides immitis RS]
MKYTTKGAKALEANLTKIRAFISIFLQEQTTTYQEGRITLPPPLSGDCSQPLSGQTIKKMETLYVTQMDEHETIRSAIKSYCVQFSIKKLCNFQASLWGHSEPSQRRLRDSVESFATVMVLGLYHVENLVKRRVMGKEFQERKIGKIQIQLVAARSWHDE